MKTQSFLSAMGGWFSYSFVKKMKWRTRLVYLSLAFLTLSCNVNQNLEEASQSRAENLAPTNLKTLPTAFLLPSTVTLNKVDLYLQKGSSTTGSVTVEIRNSLTSALAGSVTLPVSSLVTGTGWNTFAFASLVTLNRGDKYQIHLIRSDVHNYPAGNFIFWLTSSGGVDAYPDGINDPYPSWTLDYAFKTYAAGGLDQQQTLATYGFAVGNTASRWQEFKTDYPKVAISYIAINLTVGNATTGNLTLQIRNADGSVVLAENVVPTSSLLLGTKWNTFKIYASLYRDQSYRIYVTRSDPHNYFTNNYIFWNTSSGGVNAYPDGINDVYPSWTLDYAFRTYTISGLLDQHQDLNTYGFFTSNGFSRWQEFIPRN